MCLLAGIGMIVGWSFFSIKLTLYYMPFYFVGYLYGQHRDRILSNRNGQKMVDVAVTASLAVWIFIMMRYHLYLLSDSGLSIMLRVVCSLIGCIAVCGLCKGLFYNFSLNSFFGGGTAKIGVQATGIYLIHDILLVPFKMEAMPLYQTATGKLLILINWGMTMLLSVITISTLERNKLTKILTLGIGYKR